LHCKGITVIVTKVKAFQKHQNNDSEHNFTQHMIGILSALLPIYKYHI